MRFYSKENDSGVDNTLTDYLIIFCCWFGVFVLVDFCWSDKK